MSFNIFHKKTEMDAELLRFKRQESQFIKRNNTYIKKIVNEHFDYEASKLSFKKNAQKLTKKISYRPSLSLSDVLSYEKNSVQQTRETEKILRKEVEELSEIIKITRELVKNENQEILYDIEVPLILCDEFLDAIFKKLIVPYSGSQQTNPNAKLLHTLLAEDGLILTLRKRIVELMEHVSSLINNGLHFLVYNEHVSHHRPKTTSLQAHLTERTRIKRQLTGKLNYVKKELFKIDATMQKLVSVLTTNTSLATRIHETYADLKKFIVFFDDVLTVIFSRIEISLRLVKEAVILQKAYIEELLLVKTELKRLHTEFIELQKLELESAKSAYAQKVIQTRLEQFNTYKTKIAEEELHLGNFIFHLHPDQAITSIQEEEFALKNITSSTSRFMQRYKSVSQKLSSLLSI